MAMRAGAPSPRCTRRSCDDAIVYVSISADARARRSLAARDREVAMRHFSLRELVALAYDVAPSQVTGGGVWLDQPRYDFRVEVPGGMSQPEDLEPSRCAVS